MTVMFSDSFAVREATLLTPKKVAEKNTYLDWDSQPSLFKRYPDFCYRIPLCDHPSLGWLSLTRIITDERTVGGKPYRRLNVPSAGNLHPIEIYVQIRNITGLLSGIYHLDTLTQELVMIAEIAGEGCEPYLGLDQRFYGALVMISLVPFRSSWKYGLRAWRYCYLDLGHQIAALAMAVRHFGSDLTKLSLTDPDGLNRAMGMGEEERIAAVFGIGENSARPVKALREAMMKVSPTDYTIANDPLSANIKKSILYTHPPLIDAYEAYENINRSRRSAREFRSHAMSDAAIRKVMELSLPIGLEVVAIVLQAHSMQPGVYRQGKLTREGDYRAEIIHLLLKQRFIAGANMVLLIHAQTFDAHSHIEAGIYAQRLYFVSAGLGAGCSGIGAFYDDEASQWSDKALLYAVAIGGK